MFGLGGGNWAFGSALAMLALTGVVGCIDCATLTVVNESIRHDVGLPIADRGFPLSAFPWTYALIPAAGRRNGRPPRSPAICCAT